MAIEVYIIRVIELNEMIEKGESGTIDEMGDKLGIKRRQVSAYLKALAKLGKVPIFEPGKRSFIYEADSKWNVKWPQ